MSEEYQRRLAAIVSADVVAYSRLIGVNEAGTLAALRGHQEVLINPATARHGGRIVKTMGDGLLLEFPSVVNAVKCSIEVQRGMAERNADVPEDRRLIFRVGVNLGDVAADGDDIHGDGVNIAARLQAACSPGGLILSSVAYESLGSLVDATFIDGGQQQFKNIARPIQVWHWNPAPDTTGGKSGFIAPKLLALPDKPSIAVLPFDNMSGDEEQEYFSDGITEDIITALSKYRWFFVSARNSTFTYKGQAVDITKVGRELGVRYVLEGSVRKAGNRVRITAQLIEAATGNNIWAERYDRELTDIFDLQDELQEAIVAAVEPEMAGAEMERAVNKAPENLDAWDLYQKPVWHFNRRTTEDTDLAEPMFERVVALEPSFARAYAMHAWLLHNTVEYGFRTDRDEQLHKGVKLARIGVLKDDRDALTHFALGRVLTFSGEIAGGVREHRVAVQLNPNFAFAAVGLGEVLGRAGQFEESLEMIDVALRLSPLDPFRFLFFVFKGRSHDSLSQNEAAEAAYREATATNRNVAIILPHLVLVDFLVRQDRLDEGRAVMAELLQSRPGLTVTEAALAIQGGRSFITASGWRHNFIAAGLPE